MINIMKLDDICHLGIGFYENLNPVIFLFLLDF